MLVGVGFERAPLAREQPLAKLALLDALGVARLRVDHRLRVAQRFVLGPFDPGMTVVFFFQRHEQRVIVQPGVVVFAPGMEFLDLLVGRVLLEVGERQVEHVVVIGDHRSRNRRSVSGRAARRARSSGVEPAIFDQHDRG